jgi:short-subunit dehydrogenase
MGPEQVVERSLGDLARGRVLCIPGFWNRVGYHVVKLMPPGLYARLVGRFR